MKMLELKDTVLVSKDSILNREHNLWIGYSHGNKWFTMENIRALIDFGLKYTKNSLLIFIPSRMYSTNFRFVENKSRADSLKLSFEIADELIGEVRNIISELSEEGRNKILIANYDEALTLKSIEQREILLREFSKKEKFYDLVMEIADDALGIRGRTITNDRKEAVSLYILQELPFFLDGVQKVSSDLVHTVVLYPGLGKLDFLIKSIKEDDLFADLRTRLKIINATGIASIE